MTGLMSGGGSGKPKESVALSVAAAAKKEVEGPPVLREKVDSSPLGKVVKDRCVF